MKRKFLAGWMTLALLLGLVSLPPASAEVTRSLTLISASAAHQGGDNLYFLSGNFSENTLHRMYYNALHSKWQGEGGYTNWVDPGNHNALMPFGGSDAVIAYISPDYASVSLRGRAAEGITGEGRIGFSVVLRASGREDRILFESEISDTGADTPIPEIRFEVRTGDAICFVAGENSPAAAWDHVVADLILDFSEIRPGPALTPALAMERMPMTGKHEITVTDGVVDVQPLLTDAMKLKNDGDGNAYMIWQGTDGNLNNLQTEDGVNYTLPGAGSYGDCSTGVQLNRVFYSNPGWTGHAGIKYRVPADGFLSVLGKASLPSPVAMKVLVNRAGSLSLHKSLQDGVQTFADLPELNEIPVLAGDEIALIFAGTDAWQTASAALAFDFRSEPVLNDARCTFDLSGAKTDYALGEEFDGTGVSAVCSVNGGEALPAEVEADASDFDGDREGSYEIRVTCGAFSESYRVTVTDRRPKAIAGGLLRLNLREGQTASVRFRRYPEKEGFLLLKLKSSASVLRVGGWYRGATLDVRVEAGTLQTLRIDLSRISEGRVLKGIDLALPGGGRIEIAEISYSAS